ncbi:ubiquitin carboxyl-terminal hydrolase MIY1 [[Candida] anglica]|uniref:Ubiquitin carboxyl-terminal hydrolase MIY1 n=1 Tax=[Candida] anglica TaxID=148631 RepID=A0ABP0EMM2_9ASCO
MVTDTIEDTRVFFSIKHISWSEYGFHTPILLQDANGPCPLIALVNTLLLKYEFDIQQQQESVKLAGINDLRKHLLRLETKIYLDDLLSRLGDLIVNIAETSPDCEGDAAKLLDLLPQLHTGLSVNPNLITGKFPKDDLSTVLFTSLFELNFEHGWVLDEDVTVIRELEFFDKIQDFLLTNEEEVQTKEWLDANKTQVTNAGLEKLSDSLDFNNFAIYFRNNHFNTLFKSGSGDLFLLMTDSSLKSSKNIIWQSLTTVSGKDDIFYTGDFFPILDEDLQEIENQRGEVDDSDMILVKQLQEEEDQRMAEEMHKKYQNIHTKATKKLEAQDKKSELISKSKKQQTKDSDKKKKSSCIIT